MLICSLYFSILRYIQNMIYDDLFILRFLTVESVLSQDVVLPSTTTAKPPPDVYCYTCDSRTDAYCTDPYNRKLLTPQFCDGVCTKETVTRDAGIFTVGKLFKFLIKNILFVIIFYEIIY